MGVASFLLQLIFIFGLTIFLLNKYGSWRKQHLIVSISTLVGWYFSFLIILILPLDVAITFYEKCLLDETRLNNATSIREEVGNITLECEEPKGYVPVSVLLELWRVVYWTSQLLTWIVLPIMQSYSRAGEFTALGRLKSAIYSNVLYYATYAATFLFLLMYAISKGISLNFDHVKVLIVSASNTWGLFLLVLLLGYGLIEVPRQLWQMGSRGKGYRLRKTYFVIDSLSTDKNDAEETIQELYRESREVMNVLKSTRGRAREKAQQIMCKFPNELARQLNSAKAAPSFGNASNITDTDISVISNDAYLIRLHKRVIDAVQNHHRCQAQWAALISQALYLEDVEAAESTNRLPLKWTESLRWGQPAAAPTIFNKNPLEWIQLPHSVRFLWHVTVKRSILQSMGIVCFGMTLLIMWSECTFFIVHPQLSLAAKILHSAAAGYHYKYIQICAVLLLFYLGVCAYFTVFRLRIYRYYHLDPHQMTDENSLIFSAMLLCRLTPPMCLNFLGMIHLDSHITSGAKFGVETQFTKLMGHLDVIPLLAKGINIYLPISIVLLCLGTWFKIGTRVLHSLGIDQFIGDDQFTSEIVNNGKALITLERNRINRERGRDERNRAWASKMKRNTKQAASFKRTNQIEYSDCEPIIQHQDNNGLLTLDDEAAEPEGAKNDNLTNSGMASTLEDLEFGLAFGSLNVGDVLSNLESGQNRPKDEIHPTPSSIFSDL